MPIIIRNKTVWKKVLLYLIALAIVAILGRVLSAKAEFEITPQNAPVLQGKPVAVKIAKVVAKGANLANKSILQPSPELFYGIKHNEIIKRLIECESGWVNGTIIDVNGLPSRGLLKFQDSTWADFSQKSGIKGSPNEPRTAIKMADWAIENGYIKRWLNCAKSQNLLAKK